MCACQLLCKQSTSSSAPKVRMGPFEHVVAKARWVLLSAKQTKEGMPLTCVRLLLIWNAVAAASSMSTAHVLSTSKPSPL